MKTVIPYTRMLGRYHALEKMSRAGRLDHARKTVADPSGLIEDFESSVHAWATSYSNAYHAFVPEGRGDPRRKTGTAIWDTDDFAARLPKGRVTVSGRSDLDFRYVQREVSIARTDAAVFAGPEQAKRAAGRALLADLLLVNANDRTPIIGEVKVTRAADNYTDKDPTSALIQALAAAAHVVTPSQYDRLRHFFPRRFRSDQRVVDVYVITVAYDRAMTSMGDHLDAALELASTLESNLSPWIGRIALLNATPERGRIKVAPLV